MIEPEMAFYDISDNMDLAEDFLKYLVKYAWTIVWMICNFSTRCMMKN